MTLNFVGLQNNSVYAMLMPQPRLVRLLEKRARDLGVDLRWGHELSGLRPESQSVALAVSSPERDYSIVAQHLFGADGGQSLVRKATGIEFEGSTAPTVARLAHVHIPEQLRGDGGIDIPGFGLLPFGHTRLDRGGVMLADFEPSRSLFGIIELGAAVEGEPMSLAELRESARRVLGADVPFEQPKGSGPHALRRINGQNTATRSATATAGSCWLGDAARVHSPMGGPGLTSACRMR